MPNGEEIYADCRSKRIYGGHYAASHILLLDRKSSYFDLDNLDRFKWYIRTNSITTVNLFTPVLAVLQIINRVGFRVVWAFGSYATPVHEV